MVGSPHGHDHAGQSRDIRQKKSAAVVWSHWLDSLIGSRSPSVGQMPLERKTHHMADAQMGW
jgi:hypothetical protein